jgi:tetratricopeptide (TPR) repeat protein
VIDFSYLDEIVDTWKSSRRDEALLKLSEIELDKISNIYLKLRILQLRIEFIIENQDIDNTINSLSEYKEFITKNNLETNRNLSIYHFNYGKYYNTQSKWKEAEEEINKSLCLLNIEDTSPLELRDRYLVLSEIYTESNNLEKSKIQFQKLFDLKLPDKDSGEIFENYAIYLNRKAEYEKAIETLEKALSYYDIDNNVLGMASALNKLGINQRKIGNLNQALDYYMKSLEFRQQLGNLKLIAQCLNNIGIIFRLMGKFKEAIEYYLEALEIFEEISDHKSTATLIHNIALLYYHQGHIDLSLKYHESSLKRFENLKNERMVGQAYMGIGAVHFEKNDFSSAIENYNRALEIFKNFHDLSNVATARRYLIHIYLSYKELFQNKEAQIELDEFINDQIEELEFLKKKSKSEFVNLEYRLSKAMVMKRYPRFFQKLEAMAMFEEIVNSKTIDQSLKIVAMIHLCELKLLELKIQNEPDLIEKILLLISEIQRLAHQQGKVNTEIEMFILKAKLAEVDGSIHESMNFLHKAYELAEINQMEKRKEEIHEYTDNLKQNLIKIGELLKNNASISNRLEETKLLDYLKKVSMVITR